MSKLTLDEAIKHCEEVAEEQSRLYSLCPCPCDGTDNCMSLKNGKDMGCTKCAADHRQLAEWLKDYKELREKHWDECRQIAHYDNDLKEVIKLTGTTIETALENLDAKDMIRELVKYLYEAVDGFRALGKYLDDHCKIDLDCDKCPLQNGGNCRSWKHTKAVLKLIGGI